MPRNHRIPRRSQQTGNTPGSRVLDRCRPSTLATMDLPPSGWYPDPYGVPGLLRWWDGSTWTHHTHHGGGTDEANNAEPAATVQQAAVQHATVQQAAVQPATVQAASLQPTTVQPGVAGLAGSQAGGPDANGTQVLFLGEDAWASPGAPDPAAQASRYGYYRARRRRRMWLASGLGAGTVVALAVVALVVSRLGESPGAPVAAKSSARPTAQASTPSSATPSPTPSATLSNSVLADGQSGLSYTQLAAPWQPDRPSGLNNQAFTWYGAACSGPLPQ